MPNKQHSGRSTNVDDPVSLGMVTFTNSFPNHSQIDSGCIDKKIVHTPTVYGAPVRARFYRGGNAYRIDMGTAASLAAQTTNGVRRTNAEQNLATRITA